MKYKYKPGDHVRFLNKEALEEELNRIYHGRTYVNTILEQASKEFYVSEVIDNRYLRLEGLHDRTTWYGYKYGPFPYEIKPSYVSLIQEHDEIMPLFGDKMYATALCG